MNVQRDVYGKLVPADFSRVLGSKSHSRAEELTMLEDARRLNVLIHPPPRVVVSNFIGQRMRGVR